MKKIIIAGSTGMIGSHVLDYCLKSKDISQVVSLVRKSTSVKHEKLQEIIVTDFEDYSNSKINFNQIDAAFFCIGVYTGAVSDEQFKKITVDYPLAFAREIYAVSPNATFCLLSGKGADRTEKSSVAFAKYKGMAENQLATIGFKAFHTFRPAYIYPVIAREEPNLMYRISRGLYPMIRLMGKNLSIKSTELAKGMFDVAMNGHPQEILENKDILELVG